MPRSCHRSRRPTRTLGVEDIGFKCPRRPANTIDWLMNVFAEQGPGARHELLR
jgi:hypothetical protein